MLRRFLTFTSVVAAALVVAPVRAQASGIHKYVALGDSYTAVGDLPASAGGPFGCFRSTVDFPHDLAAS